MKHVEEIEEGICCKKEKYDYAETTRTVLLLLQNGRRAQQCSTVAQTTIKEINKS